jgi:putative membrane protein
MQPLPYCGLPPGPGELLLRFNLDPVLIGALVVVGVGHVVLSGKMRAYAAAGWLVAAAALISPLCALSVALFSARVAQHMILVLMAAPLIALALPPRRRFAGALWTSALAFFAALWFWHMPVPYEATFASTVFYWAMHVTLFGSAILLWRELLHPRSSRAVETLLAGTLTSMQMGLLGAVLTFAGHPLYLWHLTTTAAWGMTPLRDQQLGGILMWAPGVVLFLWAALRSLERLWTAIEEPKPEGAEPT